jgi:hypothetical protein
MDAWEGRCEIGKKRGRVCDDDAHNEIEMEEGSCRWQRSATDWTLALDLKPRLETMCMCDMVARRDLVIKIAQFVRLGNHVIEDENIKKTLPCS